ncbi:MAG: hypothetical protein RIT07_1552 [Bacteroidota bacterium]|jgi:hypothetical protein
MRYCILLLIFSSAGNASAQSIMAGVEYTNLAWKGLNNNETPANGWGRGLSLMMTKNLKPSLAWGLALSTGDIKQNFGTPGANDVAPYGKLQGQLIWSPLKAMGLANSRYNMGLIGGYSAVYLPAFGKASFHSVHADVGAGLRQSFRMGKHTGIWADVSHHQRLGADFKTFIEVRAGLVFNP